MVATRDTSARPHEALGRRLRQAVDAREMSMAGFARASGLPYRSIQSYASGDQAPGAVVLGKIKAALGVSLDWLITGDGPMFTTTMDEAEDLLSLARLAETWRPGDASTDRLEATIAAWLLKRVKTGYGFGYQLSTGVCSAPPRCLRDLDHAVKVLSTVLPGWAWSTGWSGAAAYGAVNEAHADPEAELLTTAATTAAALTAAVLRALARRGGVR